MKILIVEDDTTLASLIRTFMHAKGYETCVAGTGEEALQIIPAEKPDLVLLDIMMPGIDGRQVLAELRRTSQTPVLFITALGQQEDIFAGNAIFNLQFVIFNRLLPPDLRGDPAPAEARG